MTEVVVTVTREQVRAARLEVAAMKSAGLQPDPTIAQIAAVPIDAGAAGSVNGRYSSDGVAGRAEQDDS